MKRALANLPRINVVDNPGEGLAEANPPEVTLAQATVDVALAQATVGMAEASEGRALAEVTGSNNSAVLAPAGQLSNSNDALVRALAKDSGDAMGVAVTPTAVSAARQKMVYKISRFTGLGFSVADENIPVPGVLSGVRVGREGQSLIPLPRWNLTATNTPIYSFLKQVGRNSYIIGMVTNQKIISPRTGTIITASDEMWPIPNQGINSIQEIIYITTRSYTVKYGENYVPSTFAVSQVSGSLPSGKWVFYAVDETGFIIYSISGAATGGLQASFSDFFLNRAILTFKPDNENLIYVFEEMTGGSKTFTSLSQGVPFVPAIYNSPWSDVVQFRDQITAYFRGRYFCADKQRGILRWSEPYVPFVPKDNYIQLDEVPTAMVSSGDGLYIFSDNAVYLASGSFSPLLDDTRIDRLPMRIGAYSTNQDYDAAAWYVGGSIFVVHSESIYEIRGTDIERITPSKWRVSTFIHSTIDDCLYASLINSNSIQRYDLQTRTWSEVQTNIAITSPQYAEHLGRTNTGQRSACRTLIGVGPVAYTVTESSTFSFVVTFENLTCGAIDVLKQFERIRIRGSFSSAPTVTASVDGGASTTLTFRVSGGVDADGTSFYDYTFSAHTLANPTRGYSLALTIQGTFLNSLDMLKAPIEIYFTPIPALK